MIDEVISAMLIDGDTAFSSMCPLAVGLSFNGILDDLGANAAEDLSVFKTTVTDSN